MGKETDLQDLLNQMPERDPSPVEELVMVVQELTTEIRLLREAIQEEAGHWTISSCS